MEILLDANNPAVDSTTRARSKHLVQQPEIPLQWSRDDAVQNIKVRLEGDAGFPCVFSKNAFKKGLILFHFVES